MAELEYVNSLEQAAFVDLLGGVFEHASWVAATAYGNRPFRTVADLHAAMMAAVREAPAERRLAFLNGHPELAGPESRARAMTADSTEEQGSAGLDRLSEVDAAAFDQLNAAYRSKFGFPFIIAVRGRPLDEVRTLFEDRLKRGKAEEEASALDEVGAITRMRLDRLL